MNQIRIKSTTQFLGCFILLITSFISNAQGNEATSLLPNIIPPSPSSYSLGNYGNVPVGLVNGTSNIDIPLFTYATKNLSMPVKVFYGSNGIKVDDISSSVGLGWNMTAGGIITRSVNDVADEKNNIAPASIPNDTILDDGTLTSVDINYFYSIGNNDGADSETDIFSFNFNGVSGKFVLDKDQNPVLVENQNVKIEKIIDSGKITFIVTTNDGVKYYFTETETTMFRAQNAGFSPPGISTSSWYLTRVKHPLGDEIYLEYENNDYNFIASESQALLVSNPYTQNNCEGSNSYQYGPVLTNITSHSMSVSGKHIKKIYSNNTINGVLNFLYYTDNDPEVSVGGNKKMKEIQLVNSISEIIEKVNFNYTVLANKRTFLNEIVFKDINKSYKFEYITPEQLPLRLSKSQDHWGYYNGKSNTTLVPEVPNVPDIQFTKANKEPDAAFTKMGMLKKIVYPTKGSSEFEYEANTYRGEKITKPLPTGGYLTVNIGPITTDPDAVKLSEETIYLPFGQLVQIGGWGEFNLDNQECTSGMNTGHSQAYMSVREVETNTAVVLLKKAQSGALYVEGTAVTLMENMSVNTFYFNGQAGRHYKITLKANIRCTAGGVSFSYYNTLPQVTYDNIVTGGIRVKSIKDMSEDKPYNYKRFHYSSLNNLNMSSGISSGNPYYISNSTRRIVCTGTGPTSPVCTHVDVNNLVLNSSSMLALYDKGANVYYKEVTISYGDDAFLNGGENHQFIISRDLPGEPLSGTDFNHSSRTNSGWDNGLESKVIYFKKGDTPNSFLYLKESSNTYALDSRINKEVYSYPVRKNFTLDCFSFGQPDSIENLDIMRTVTAAHWNYLASNETKEYYYNTNNIVRDSIVNKTNYWYDNPNPNHLQLTRKESIINNTEKLTAKYVYPPDLISETGMSELVSTNRIVPAVVTEEYNGTTLISKSKTIYAKDASTANLLLPKNVYAAKFPNALPNLTVPAVGQLENKISYDSYDANGNITQYSLANDAPVSIIWGYNKTQPIAKIEGSYTTIPAALITAAQTQSDTGTEAGLRTALAALRNDAALVNAMVTTYTYIPLVGVKTITDSKGIITYYQYDSLNRLVVIKDENLNILKTYCYNYQGQTVDCFSINPLPTIPTGLSFTSATSSSVSFSWSAVLGATGYKIYKNGTYVSSTTATTGSLLGLAAATSYNVQVLAYNSEAESALCSSVPMSTTLAVPVVPIGLSFTSATNSTVNFSWNAVSGATGYKIYKNGTYVSSVTTTAGSLSGLASATSYNVQILAYNTAGDGALCSSVAMSTTAISSTDAVEISFNRESGTCTLYKNGTSYLTKSTAGTISGTLTTGDTFYVMLSGAAKYSKSLSIFSSVRGYLLDVSDSGAAITSATFTKQGSEIITIDAVTVLIE